MEYKKDKENKVDDALSRRLKLLTQPLLAKFLDGDTAQPVNGEAQSLEGAVDQPVLEEQGYLFLISFPCPTWLTMLKNSYITDEEYQQLLSALTSSAFGLVGFSL